MKKLINTIKSWFRIRTISEADYLFQKCSQIAEDYGDVCRHVNIGIILHGNDYTRINVWMHSSTFVINLDFDKEVDFDKCLASFELNLIKHHGKKEN